MKVIIILNIILSPIIIYSQPTKEFVSIEMERDRFLSNIEVSKALLTCNKLREKIKFSKSYSNELLIHVDQQIRHKTRMLYLVRFDSSGMEIYFESYGEREPSLSAPTVTVDSTNRVFKEFIHLINQVPPKYFYQRMILKGGKKRNQYPHTDEIVIRTQNNKIDFSHLGIDYVEYRNQSNYPGYNVRDLIKFIEVEVMLLK